MQANQSLRCYGYRMKNGIWYGLCIDLDIAVEAKSSEHLKNRMNMAIESYIKTVIDTNDKKSIPALLNRRAPLKNRFTYYYISLASFIIKLKFKPSNFIFRSVFPSYEQ